MSKPHGLKRRPPDFSGEDDWLDYPVFEPPTTDEWDEDHVLSTIHIVFDSLNDDEYYLIDNPEVDSSTRHTIKLSAVSKLKKILNQKTPEAWYLREIFKWVYSVHTYAPKREKVAREIGHELGEASAVTSGARHRLSCRSDRLAKPEFQADYRTTMEKFPDLNRREAIEILDPFADEEDRDQRKYGVVFKTLYGWATEADRKDGRVRSRGRKPVKN